jgi:hypothetical protein
LGLLVETFCGILSGEIGLWVVLRLGTRVKQFYYGDYCPDKVKREQQTAVTKLTALTNFYFLPLKPIVVLATAATTVASINNWLLQGLLSDPTSGDGWRIRTDPPTWVSVSWPSTRNASLLVSRIEWVASWTTWEICSRWVKVQVY